MTGANTTSRKEAERIDIPAEIPREDVLAEFKQERTRAKVETIVDDLIDMATEAARPKGLFRVCRVEERDRDGVVVDGVRLTSRVLSKNLSDTCTVIPELVTCGRELDELPVSPKDFIRYYCLDVIKTVVMFHATEYFFNYLKDTFNLTEMVHLHPGEFGDWPITEQAPLFQLLGDTEASIGVKLTSSLTLQPVKSGSGLVFSSDHSFESCQLCLQANCPGRRKPYNPRLVKQFTE